MSCVLTQPDPGKSRLSVTAWHRSFEIRNDAAVLRSHFHDFPELYPIVSLNLGQNQFVGMVPLFLIKTVAPYLASLHAKSQLLSSGTKSKI